MSEVPKYEVLYRLNKEGAANLFDTYPPEHNRSFIYYEFHEPHPKSTKKEPKTVRKYSICPNPKKLLKMITNLKAEHRCFFEVVVGTSAGTRNYGNFSVKWFTDFDQESNLDKYTKQDYKD